MAIPAEDWAPADIDDVRATLGEPDAVFSADRHKLFVQATAFFVCSMGLVAGWILIYNLSELSRLIAPLIGLTTVTLLGIFYWLRSRLGFEILIYPKWIVVIDRGRLEALMWDSVTACTIGLGQKLVLLRQGKSPFLIPALWVKNSQQLIELVAARRYAARGRVVLGRALSSIDLGRLSVAATQAVRASEQIARELHHDYVGTEHLLLALLRQGGNDVRAAVERLGISPARIRDLLEEKLERGSAGQAAQAAQAAQSSQAELPMTPMLGRVLQKAQAEQLSGGDGSLAVLRALFSEPQAVACVVLVQEGLTFAALLH